MVKVLDLLQLSHSLAGISHEGLNAGELGASLRVAMEKSLLSII
jgi:hypothetical protein